MQRTSRRLPVKSKAILNLISACNGRFVRIPLVMKASFNSIKSSSSSSLRLLLPLGRRTSDEELLDDPEKKAHNGPNENTLDYPSGFLRVEFHL